MVYTTDDIEFAKLSPKDFERLCFELLLKYGYRNLIWRQGGADNGRDIEGYFEFINPINIRKTKWFFECKHYTKKGVPPDQLNSKIAWADAEQPSFLVLFVSSYITTASRTWLEKLQKTKQYKILILEGDEIKRRLIQFPDLVERFFASDRFEQLFLQIKNHWLRHRIDPSYESIIAIIENIDLSRFDLNDLGFILMSFHRNYRLFDLRNIDYGDFFYEAIFPLLPYLIKFSSNKELRNFEEYKTDFEYLGGVGVFDKAEDYEESALTFQFYELHLHYNESRDKWKIGYYLFLKDDCNQAFELFSLDDSDFDTSSKFYSKFSFDTLTELAVNLSDEFCEKISKFGIKLFEVD